MELVVYYILPIAGSLFLIGYMFYAMYQMREHPADKKIKWWAAVLYTVLVIICPIADNTFLNAVSILGMAFFGSWLFQASGILLVYYLVLCVSVFVTDLAVIFILQLLVMTGNLYFTLPILNTVFFIVAVRMAEFIVIRFLVFLVRRRTESSISIKQLAVSLVLPAFTILNMYTLLYYQQIYITEEMAWLFFMNLVILVGLNLFFVLLADAMSVRHRLENERNLYRQQAKIQYCYYEREEEKYEETRKLIHDIRNHMQALEELYQKDAASDAAAYANSIHQILNSFGQKYYTSDRLLNIILNDKAQSLQRLEIREDFKVGDIDLSFMRDVDITTLFANLLDNAVDAARNSKEPFIRLRVNPARGFLSVVMENSSDQEPVRTRNGFRSHKAGHDGLGLKNIQTTVENYNGDIHYIWQDGIFKTNIMLMAQERVR